jgi:tetratricopeptide (TPR) repeat protein
MGLHHELGIALLSLGIWFQYKGEYDESIQTMEESLLLLRPLHDPFLNAACLIWLGWSYYELGDYDQAGEHFQEAIDDCVEKGNILGLPYALSKMGALSDALQAYDEGVSYHKQAQKYFEAIGDQAGQGYALSRMSLSAWGLKDYDKALEYGRAGYDQFETIGHRWGIANSLCRIGFAELALGLHDAAQTHFYEGLERAIEYGFPSTANYAVIGLGMLWAAEGEVERAVTILTIVSDQANTPGLYKDIAGGALDELKSKLDSERFTHIQSSARDQDYEAVMAEIRREQKLAGR